MHLQIWVTFATRGKLFRVSFSEFRG